MGSRNRRPPLWSADYTFGEGLSEDDDANMALLVISYPTSFEEAVKSQQLKQAMDEEIKINLKKSNLALDITTC